MPHFSAKPKTEWNDDHHLMTLTEELTYTDSDGKEWKVPVGAELNGATIPKALWSRVGSPFVGKYRRASIVHDYFVGEGSNPNVGKEERKAADKMFYDACIADGCTKFFAKILYLGVCIGTWAAHRPKRSSRHDEEYKEHPDDKMIQARFDAALLTLESEFADEKFRTFNELDDRILEELFV